MMQITQRELLELRDRLMDHASLIDKFSFYRNHCQNQQLRQILQRHQGILQNHYNEMRNMLQQAQQGAGFTGQQPQYQQQQYTTAQAGYPQS